MSSIPAAPRWDILGIGCVAVDDLLYVEAYPAPDAKVRIRPEPVHAWATSSNSSHPSLGCNQEGLSSTGGDGLFCCFSVK